MFIKQTQIKLTAGLMFLCVLIFTACGGGSGSGGGGGGKVVNSSKSILAFYFTNPAATGIINEANSSITVTVPYGTNVTSLEPVIAHTGISINPDSGTARDFTNSVFYSVTAEDKTTQDYSVTVIIAANHAKAITAFNFSNPAATGIINEANHSIMVPVPYGTDVTSIAPTIAHTGASVSPGSGVPRNFTNPVPYTVTAANNSTQNYSVTVTIAPNHAKAITAFNFTNPAATGVMNEINHTVAVTVPYGTNRANLVPIITHTGSSISPSSGTAQNFTNPVTYTVTAANLTIQDYTVTVTVAANSAKAITAFNITNPVATGLINETNHTIVITVVNDTDVTALVPVITHTGASISPASGVARNFVNPVTYTVTAADSTTQNYTVTISKLAEVTTMEIAGNLTFTGSIIGAFADGGGNVTNIGSSQVTDRGLVWNTTENPTISDFKASDSTSPTGQGEFSDVSMTGLIENTIYYVRAYATNSQGTAYGNQVTFNSGWICGTEYEGGYVFYNNGNGGGLVCALNDHASSQVWITGGLTQTTLNGNTSMNMGTGLDNSNAIVTQTGHTGSAAQICFNYDDGTYDGWFLPSAIELDYMYFRLKEDGIGNFTDEYYWSSSEDDAGNAWAEDFTDGSSYSAGKGSLRRIRAVRKIK